MSYYRLRYDQTEVEIPPGEFIVGRSESSAIVIDHSLVSRRHARFVATERALTVEDLVSRNGVQVNRETIHGATALHDGDVVTVGVMDFHVVQQLETTLPAWKPPAPRPPAEEVGEATALSNQDVLLEEALRVQNIPLAESLLRKRLARTRVFLEAGVLDPQRISALTGYALVLAERTDAACWLEAVFDLNRAAKRMLPGSTVDQLYTVTRKVHMAYGPSLRAYLTAIQARAAELTPPERFALQRLDGLAKMLRV